MQRNHAIAFQFLGGAAVLMSVGITGWYLGGHFHGALPTAAASAQASLIHEPPVNIDRRRGLQLAKAAHAMLDDKLADYPSARFKDVYEVHYLGDHRSLTQNAKRGASDPDSYVLCGLMNGKNAFGAYTGWVPFTVEAGELHIPTMGDSLREGAIIDSYCGGKGHGVWDAIRQIEADNRQINASDIIISAANIFGTGSPSDRERLIQQKQEKIQELKQDTGKLRRNLFPILPHTVDRSDEYARAISWSPQTARHTAK